MVGERDSAVLILIGFVHSLVDRQSLRKWTRGFCASNVVASIQVGRGRRWKTKWNTMQENVVDKQNMHGGSTPPEQGWKWARLSNMIWRFALHAPAEDTHIVINTDTWLQMLVSQLTHQNVTLLHCTHRLVVEIMSLQGKLDGCFSACKLNVPALAPAPVTSNNNLNDAAKQQKTVWTDNDTISSVIQSTNQSRVPSSRPRVDVPPKGKDTRWNL